MMHHAVLVEDCLRSVRELCGFYIDYSTTEITEFPYTEIGIDEVRLLTVESARTPNGKTRRCIVVVVTSLTHEAQNALLKLLEEPPVTTQFLFILRSSIALLPTLRSRFFVVDTQDQESHLAKSSGFISISIPERLTLIQECLDAKDGLWIQAVKSEIEQCLRRGVFSSLSQTDKAALSLATSRLGGRGASNKMLLEEMALTLPSVVASSTKNATLHV